MTGQLIRVISLPLHRTSFNHISLELLPNVNASAPANGYSTYCELVLSQAYLDVYTRSQPKHGPVGWMECKSPECTTKAVSRHTSWVVTSLEDLDVQTSLRSSTCQGTQFESQPSTKELPLRASMLSSPNTTF